MQHPAKRLDQVRAACRLRHLSLRTEAAYLGWIRRYIAFQGVRRLACAVRAAPLSRKRSAAIRWV
jgi:hypothetical protein